MKIGYPCLNWTLDCKANRSFRLANYSQARLFESVANNLSCLQKILEYNLRHGFHFFRITSDLVPFASHAVCTAAWQSEFAAQFEKTGSFIRKHEMRISMHPGQYTLVNTPSEKVFQNSIRELRYHAEVLDLMELDTTAKIQLHIGGVYGDKAASLQRFVDQFALLPESVQRRLVIENDDRMYHLDDCLYIHEKTGIPILFDVFHHEVFGNGDSLRTALEKVRKTWRDRDGIPLLDYSSQKPGARPGSHIESIDIRHFRQFLEDSVPYDFDLMLEIKDKETSALQAVAAARSDARFTPK